jgi:hypothetical protein
MTGSGILEAQYREPISRQQATNWSPGEGAGFQCRDSGLTSANENNSRSQPNFAAFKPPPPYPSPSPQAWDAPPFGISGNISLGNVDGAFRTSTPGILNELPSSDVPNQRLRAQPSRYDVSGRTSIPREASWGTGVGYPQTPDPNEWNRGGHARASSYSSDRAGFNTGASVIPPFHNG